jgi:two-component system, NarL family, sensor kinase
VRDFAIVAVALAPAVSIGASGIALLRTRSRPAGAMLLATAAGVIAALLSDIADRSTLTRYLLAGSVLVLGPFAVFCYPRASVRHALEFCLWVTAGGAGLLGTMLAARADVGLSATFGAIVVLVLFCRGWFVLEKGEDRDQEAILWLGLVALPAVLTFTVLAAQFGPRGAAASVIPATAIGPAMVIGVRRPGLTDIRALVVLVVVFVVVAVSYVSVFIAAAATFETLGIGDPPAALYASIGLVLAAGFQPLRVVLRGLIDELLFGQRPDPLVAATTVAGRIGDDPLLALRAIREALLLPYASISTDGTELAASGTAVTETRRLPLLRDGKIVGEVVVGLRPGELKLSPDDEQVLRIVGPLLAQTLRARALALDLKESRTAAITAIEEERRRLRRDLHDGLGPTLSGLAHTAAAARNIMVTDPTAADALLQGLRSDAAAAVGEIRRLVYNMRPPALDELGLVAALRQQISVLRTPTGSPMHVFVEADELPTLGASVEVAAFRIATEAVTNSARHSGTDQVWLQISHEHDRLVVSIRDEGSSDSAWTAGVGLASMRERAAEIGGSIEINSNSNGSVVTALLPLD